MSEADSAAAKKVSMVQLLYHHIFMTINIFLQPCSVTEFFFFFGTVIIMNRTCHDSAKRSLSL
jgi:hypothetical protein